MRGFEYLIKATDRQVIDQILASSNLQILNFQITD